MRFNEFYFFVDRVCGKSVVFPFFHFVVYTPDSDSMALNLSLLWTGNKSEFIKYFAVLLLLNIIPRYRRINKRVQIQLKRKVRLMKHEKSSKAFDFHSTILSSQSNNLQPSSLSGLFQNSAEIVNKVKTENLSEFSTKIELITFLSRCTKPFS